MRRRASFVYVVIVGIMLAGVVAVCPPAAGQDRPFVIGFAPYIWAPGINGHAAVHGVDFGVNKSFTQIVGEADSVIGLFGRVDARYDRLGFYIDGGFTRVAASTPIRTGNVEGKFDTGIADFALTYRLLDWTEPTTAVPRIAVDALLGGRYMYLSADVDFPRFSLSQEHGWVDPVAGAEGYVDFGEHWRIMLHGDVGAGASDLTWSAAAYLAYRFDIGTVQSSVFLGYKAISEDYSTGTGRNQLTWDTILHGPVIGMSFRF